MMAREASTVVITTASADDTRQIGALLGRAAAPGTVLLLDGELGVGKTVLVQGLAEGLGVVEPVTSPSFVLMVEHVGRLTLYHVDLYRLGGRVDDELYEALEDGVAAGGVVAIEWPGGIPDDLRAGATTIGLVALDDARRLVSVTTADARLLAAVQSAAAETGHG